MTQQTKDEVDPELDGRDLKNRVAMKRWQMGAAPV